jgi:hypothetical protein
LRDSSKLLVAAHGSELSETRKIYDLKSDPTENRPNPRELAAEAEALDAALRAELEGLAQRASRDTEKGSIDAATKEKLRALGYGP